MLIDDRGQAAACTLAPSSSSLHCSVNGEQLKVRKAKGEWDRLVTVIPHPPLVCVLSPVESGNNTPHA
jgi:hypothetical protein